MYLFIYENNPFFSLDFIHDKYIKKRISFNNDKFFAIINNAGIGFKIPDNLNLCLLINNKNELDIQIINEINNSYPAVMHFKSTIYDYNVYFSDNNDLISFIEFDKSSFIINCKLNDVLYLSECVDVTDNSKYYYLSNTDEKVSCGRNWIKKVELNTTFFIDNYNYNIIKEGDKYILFFPILINTKYLELQLNQMTCEDQIKYIEN